MLLAVPKTSTVFFIYFYSCCPADNLIKIQFDNSSYCANESTGKMCAVVTVVGCV